MAVLRRPDADAEIPSGQCPPRRLCLPPRCRFLASWPKRSPPSAAASPFRSANSTQKATPPRPVLRSPVPGMQAKPMDLLKRAARYASQPTLTIDKPGNLAGGFQGFLPGMGMAPALTGMGHNSALARTAQASGANQNPAAQPAVPRRIWRRRRERRMSWRNWARFGRGRWRVRERRGEAHRGCRLSMQMCRHVRGKDTHRAR
jgi:hypothetical protein